VKRYEDQICEMLGVVDDRQYSAHRDWSRRLLPKFGRMRGMWRCHFMAAEILQAWRDGSPDRAAALTVQMLKVLHQLAVDGGSWDTAMMLWPAPDPLASDEFGGSELEMRRIHAYRKAVSELRKKVQSTEQEESEETPGKGSGGGGRGRGRGKKNRREGGGEAEEK
jgi:hypothetical protein